jgi:hypothetical protein
MVLNGGSSTFEGLRGLVTDGEGIGERSGTKAILQIGQSPG